MNRYYDDEEYRTFRGFRVFAIDGSSQQLPDSPQLRAEYGVATGKRTFAVAKARASQLYDVLNGIVVDAVIAPFRTGERELARQHVEAFLRLAARQIATIMLFGRGYPSLPLLFYLISHQIRPVMRVPVSFYPKIIGVAKSNTWVTLTLSSAQARQVRAMGVEATAGTAVRLRVIKLRLSTGQIETLVTTLTEEEMPEEAFDELYALRWGIEVHYGQEKYALEIENFSTCTVAQIGSLSTPRPGIRPPIAIPILRPCTSGRAPDCATEWSYWSVEWIRPLTSSCHYVFGDRPHSGRWLFHPRWPAPPRRRRPQRLPRKRRRRSRCRRLRPEPMPSNRCIIPLLTFKVRRATIF